MTGNKYKIIDRWVGGGATPNQLITHQAKNRPGKYIAFHMYAYYCTAHVLAIHKIMHMRQHGTYNVHIHMKVYNLSVKNKL